MVKVFVRKIEELNIDEKQNILNSLSDTARARLNKKKNDALYLASLCALSLLTDTQRADLDYTESGRPFFKALNADISISHSSTLAAIAVSNSKDEPVGIDVEDIKPQNNISPRFFTPNEQIALENGTPYIEIWTKKEALFKHLKNDSIQFIHLDSTTSSAKFTTINIDNSLLSACTPEASETQIIQK